MKDAESCIKNTQTESQRSVKQNNGLQVIHSDESRANLISLPNLQPENASAGAIPVTQERGRAPLETNTSV